jgi:hypothetical protein
VPLALELAVERVGDFRIHVGERALEVVGLQVGHDGLRRRSRARADARP